MIGLEFLTFWTKFQCNLLWMNWPDKLFNWMVHLVTISNLNFRCRPISQNILRIIFFISFEKKSYFRLWIVPGKGSASKDINSSSVTENTNIYRYITSATEENTIISGILEDENICIFCGTFPGTWSIFIVRGTPFFLGLYHLP